MYGTGNKKMLNMLILEILQKYSDEGHPLTQQEIEGVSGFLQMIAGFRKGLMKKPLPHGGVADLEIRVDLYELKLIPDQRLAEGMNRRYLHQVDSVQGVLNAGQLPVLQQPLPDSFLHFRGRRGRKGNDQKALRLGAVLQHLNDPLHHHRRFSAGGGGAADNFLRFGLNHPLLRSCPFRHALTSFPCFPR